MLGVVIKICATFSCNGSVTVVHPLTPMGCQIVENGPGIPLKIVFQVFEMASQTGSAGLRGALWWNLNVRRSEPVA